MKIIITLLRKNGRVRSWTNSDPYEHSGMAVCIYKDAVKRLDAETGITEAEADYKIRHAAKLIEL